MKRFLQLLLLVVSLGFSVAEISRLLEAKDWRMSLLISNETFMSPPQMSYRRASRETNVTSEPKKTKGDDGDDGDDEDDEDGDYGELLQNILNNETLVSAEKNITLGHDEDIKDLVSKYENEMLTLEALEKQFKSQAEDLENFAMDQYEEIPQKQVQILNTLKNSYKYLSKEPLDKLQTVYMKTEAGYGMRLLMELYPCYMAKKCLDDETGVSSDFGKEVFLREKSITRSAAAANSATAVMTRIQSVINPAKMLQMANDLQLIKSELSTPNSWRRETVKQKLLSVLSLSQKQNSALYKFDDQLVDGISVKEANLDETEMEPQLIKIGLQIVETAMSDKSKEAMHKAHAHFKDRMDKLRFEYLGASQKMMDKAHQDIVALTHDVSDKRLEMWTTKYASLLQNFPVESVEPIHLDIRQSATNVSVNIDRLIYQICRVKLRLLTVVLGTLVCLLLLAAALGLLGGICRGCRRHIRDKRIRMARRREQNRSWMSREVSDLREEIPWSM